MVLLGGSVGLFCWVVLLGGSVGWFCWVVLLGGSVGLLCLLLMFREEDLSVGATFHMMFLGDVTRKCTVAMETVNCSNQLVYLFISSHSVSTRSLLKLLSALPVCTVLMDVL